MAVRTVCRRRGLTIRTPDGGPARTKKRGGAIGNRPYKEEKCKRNKDYIETYCSETYCSETYCSETYCSEAYFSKRDRLATNAIRAARPPM
jgi:hypothetical protein